MHIFRTAAGKDSNKKKNAGLLKVIAVAVSSLNSLYLYLAWGQVFIHSFALFGCVLRAENEWSQQTRKFSIVVARELDSSKNRYGNAIFVATNICIFLGDAIFRIHLSIDCMRY